MSSFSRIERTLAASIAEWWRVFVREVFDDYRPELHYMRGPGPKWRAKHLAEPRGASRASLAHPLPRSAVASPSSH
jgi:hypothetical protein